MLEGKKSRALEIQLVLKPWHADLAKHVVKRTAESLNKRQTHPFCISKLTTTPAYCFYRENFTSNTHVASELSLLLGSGHYSAISSYQQLQLQQGIAASAAGEKQSSPARPPGPICCPALGKSLTDCTTNLTRSLFIRRLSSTISQISCKTIFAEVVFSRTDWETGFDIVEASCVKCFRSHLFSFCILQSFSSLQPFLKHWNFLLWRMLKSSALTPVRMTPTWNKME